MPAFDQRRDGLHKGSHGGVERRTTAGSILVAYIASHGYSIDPNIADWEVPVAQ